MISCFSDCYASDHQSQHNPLWLPVITDRDTGNTGEYWGREIVSNYQLNFDRLFYRTLWQTVTDNMDVDGALLLLCEHLEYL